MTLPSKIQQQMKKPTKEPIPYQTWTLEQIKEELRTNERYQVYFDRYAPASIEKFIEKYADVKYEVFSQYDHFEKHHEFWETQFLIKADKYIDRIMQKKLFNLQCQWRAGLIELPHILMVEDFHYWSEHIRDCPCVPIVTPEDIDLCIKFLGTEYDYIDKWFILGNKWQGYENFKTHIEAEENEEPLVAEGGIPFINSSPMPQMYHFFDTYQNTGSLLNLPDVRGPIEEKYWRLGYHIESEQKKKEQAEKDRLNPPPPFVPSNWKPDLYPFPWSLKEFVNETENPESQKAFKYIYEARNMEHFDEFEDALCYLQGHKGTIAIEANEDWREGVILALHKYEQQKIMELLPHAYEMYLMEFDDPEDFDVIIANRLARHKPDEKSDEYEWVVNKRRWFKMGRKELEGREDFDYL